MADTVFKLTNADFSIQATQHRNLANHTREMLSMAQKQYDTMVIAVQGTSISDIIPGSGDWFEKLKNSCLSYIDINDQMADKLEKAAAAFDQTDSVIGDGFSSGPFSNPAQTPLRLPNPGKG